MKVFLLFTGSGPLVILTSYDSVKTPALLEMLAAKGIGKFIAHEVPLAVAKQRYGGHFSVVAHDLKETDALRVLDYNGERAFRLFHLGELGAAIEHEGAFEQHAA